MTAGLRLLLAVYELLWLALLPAALVYFRIRGRRDPDYRRHWGERLGGPAGPEGAVWVHAVSLGELRSAIPLIRGLLDGGARVVTTHMTPAGRRAAEAAFGPEIAAGRLCARYVPLDAGWIWARALRRHRPRLLVVLEIEIWPGMIAACRRAGVPLVLANSQLPERSFRRQRWLARLTGHPVVLVPLVLAKSALQAERFRALGAPRVEVVGELRFDLPVPEAQRTAAAALRARLGDRLGDRPVVTLASVVAGEEETCLAALRALADRDVLAVWVPRAPERFEATAEWLASQGVAVARRTAVLDDGLALRAGASLDGAQVLLGDSFGEMFFYLGLADAAVVGGGFVPKGAHNVIEPLAMGLPVLVGPHVWTIEYPGREAMAAGVVAQCADAPALALALRGVLAGPEARAVQRARAEAFLAEHGGATARTLAALAPLLAARP
jgi:3-deoxy-D-manno-octulosonic-acid transferase